jgi:hypothetical protein
MIYKRIIFLILFILQSFLISCGSSIKDVAIKKHDAAFYYYEQGDSQNAKRLCDEALDLWRTIKNSNIKSVPNWSIEDRINRCEKLLEIIPTSEALKTPTPVPIRIVKNAIYVNATLNQKENVTLLLDTGSTHTIITPGVAELLDINPKKDAPKDTIILLGGKTIEVPYVSLLKIKVGDAVVNNLMVGVYSVFPDAPLVDGILGADFLRHFTVTVDHHTKRLRLASQREGPEEKIIKKAEKLSADGHKIKEDKPKLASTNESEASPKKLTYKLAIFPWILRNSAGRYRDFVISPIVKDLTKFYRNQGYYGMVVIDKIKADENVYWKKQSFPSKPLPNVKSICELGKELKADIVLICDYNVTEHGVHIDAEYVRIFLIDINTQKLFSIEHNQKTSIYQGDFNNVVDSLSSKIVKSYRDFHLYR